MAISGEILRGHTDTIILNILKNGDSYGYEIAKIIHDKSQGFFEIKDATIYTAFRRLELDNFILAYWGDGVEGARRRYYSITEKGKIELSKLVGEWKTASGILDELIGG